MKKETQRKLTALVLTLMLLLSLVPAGVQAAPSAVWDGTKASEFAGGSGTENDPYLIADGAQLAYLGSFSWKKIYCRIVQDIYLNDTAGWESWTAESGPANVWTPLCTGEYFNGTLDGGGHTIYGMYVSSTAEKVGLFASVSRGTVKNLTIADSAVFGSERAGAFAGAAENCTFSCCTTYASVTGTSSYIGGIVGRTGIFDADHCVNYGTVSGEKIVGGIAGDIAGGGAAGLICCDNHGTVSGIDNSEGGIVGSCQEISVKNCTNDGAVTGGSRVGGIAGQASEATFSCCSNTAAMDTSAYDAGGILGVAYDGTVTVESCTNSGAISARGSVGGIAGYVMSNIETFYCTNYGDITSAGGGAGGIVGDMGYHVAGSVCSCVNYGAIDGGEQYSYCGGIVGSAGSLRTGKVVNCANLGTVRAAYGVGGIVGEGNNYLTVMHCVNAGAPTANSWPGSIVGYAGNSAVSSCYALTGLCAEDTEEEGKLSLIDEAQWKSADFLAARNVWVAAMQRPDTGYAGWIADENGCPVPMGTVSAYTPVSGTLTAAEAENGTLTLSAASAMTEEEVSVTLTPAAGYIVQRAWYVTAEDPGTEAAIRLTGNEGRFSMPYGDTTVYAQFIALPAQTVWDGTVAAEFLAGSGTENDPYLIADGAQLAYLGSFSWKEIYCRIVQDIYLNDTAGWESWTAESGPANVWTPLCPNGYFTGTLDGGSHTIYGMYISCEAECAGLFSFVRGSVRDLTIADSAVFGTTRVGAFAGNCSASSSPDATLTHCVSYARVEATGSEVGGIVGHLYEYCTLQDCRNYGPVKNVNDTYANGDDPIRTGGIAGSAGESISILRCENAGDISSYGSQIGGIVGYMFTDGVLEDCKNTGTVTALKPGTGQQQSSVGGISGGCAERVSLSRCENTGRVVSEAFGVGGISGRGDSGLITQCVNRGEVIASVTVGGIVGSVYTRDEGTQIAIEDCYNCSAVKGNDYVGGIAGELNAASTGTGITLSRCYDLGAVSVSTRTGAIVGHAGANSGAALQITDCYYPNTIPRGYVFDKTSKTVSASNVTALSAAAMKTAASYAGFDFQTVWYCAEDGTYPQLRWEYLKSLDPIVAVKQVTPQRRVVHSGGGWRDAAGQSTAADAPGAWYWYSVPGHGDTEFTLTFASGTERTMAMREIADEYGIWPEFSGGDPQYETHWQPGNTYRVTLYFGEIPCTFAVELTETPFTSIETTGYQVYGEYTHGGWRDANGNEADANAPGAWFYYKPFYYDDLTLSVTLAGETRPRSMTVHELFTTYGVWPQYADLQSAGQPWQAGKIYPLELFFGDVSCTLQIWIGEPRDLNGDRGVSLTDLQCLYTYLSAGENEGRLEQLVFMAAADANGDGVVNILDYQALYELVK